MCNILPKIGLRSQTGSAVCRDIREGLDDHPYDPRRFFFPLASKLSDASRLGGLLMNYVMTIANSVRSQTIATDPLYRLSTRCGVGGLLCLVLAACTRDISGAHSVPPMRADTSMLTAEIGRTLSPTGLFNLIGQPAGSIGELTESQARAIGRAWAHQFFPWVQGPLERQRGLKIDGAKLRDCPRLYYAESPYAPVEDTTDGGVVRRVFGSWWVVPLCVNGVPQVALGIAAYATDIEIQNNRIVFPRTGGGEFVWRGIPSDASGFPLSPEAAARFVAIKTGARVASAPRLIMPHFRDGGPALARWEMAIVPSITLQTLQGQNASVAASVVVGPVGPGQFDPILFRPSKDQPNEVQTSMASATSKRVDRPLMLRRKNGGILRLEAAEVRKP